MREVVDFFVSALKHRLPQCFHSHCAALLSTVSFPTWGIYPIVHINPAPSGSQISRECPTLPLFAVSFWLKVVGFLLNTALINDPLGKQTLIESLKCSWRRDRKISWGLLPVVVRSPHSLHRSSCPPGQEVTQTPPSPRAQTQEEVQGEGLYSWWWKRIPLTQ